MLRGLEMNRSKLLNSADLYRDFVETASLVSIRPRGLIRPFPYLAFRAKASRRLPY